MTTKLITPILACFPVLTLFTSLFLLIVCILATGMGTTDATDAPAEASAEPTKYPAWWTFALIPVVLGSLLWFLEWCTRGN